METEPPLGDREDADEPASAEAAFVTRGLTLGYGSRAVLEDLDLVIPKGAITAVYGHNGAGKTTLMKGLAGFVKKQSGTVEYLGADVSGLRAAQRSRLGIRYVPQMNGVFPNLTVRENLTVGNDGHAQMDLERTLAVFPALDAKLKNKAGSLSGGQRQMLAIAMALIGQPSALLLDEPSTGLAPVIVDEVLHALKSLHASTGITIVIVESSIAKTQLIAHNVFVIQVGEVVFRGTPEELDAHPDVTSLL